MRIRLNKAVKKLEGQVGPLKNIPFGDDDGRRNFQITSLLLKTGP
jgi:hypothetical protein